MLTRDRIRLRQHTRSVVFHVTVAVIVVHLIRQDPTSVDVNRKGHRLSRRGEAGTDAQIYAFDGLGRLVNTEVRLPPAHLSRVPGTWRGTVGGAGDEGSVGFVVTAETESTCYQACIYCLIRSAQVGTYFYGEGAGIIVARAERKMAVPDVFYVTPMEATCNGESMYVDITTANIQV